MTRRMALIALAVVLALAGTFAVYSYAHHADQRAVAATHATTVVYAKNDIPAGTTWADAVKQGRLATEQVPVGAVPASALTDLQASVPDGQVANAAIGAGQIMVRPMFAAKASTTGPLQIPGNDIAVSVSLPSNADVAGYVQNGSQVAIFTTSEVATASGGKYRSETSEGSSNSDSKLYLTKLLLPRVDVLAVSQAAPTQVDGGSSSAGLTSSQSSNDVLVTLAVSQADAQRLLLAQHTGELYLALLSQDSKTAPDGGVVNVVTTKPAQIYVK